MRAVPFAPRNEGVTVMDHGMTGRQDGLLRLLRRGLGCDVAFIGRMRGDRLAIERTSPQGACDQDMLSLPRGWAARELVVFGRVDGVSPARAALGFSPDFLAVAPIGQDGRYLVLAGDGPAPAAEEVTEAVAVLLRAGAPVAASCDPAANVGHDLRTPLTSVIGALGLLKGGAVAALPASAAGLVDIAHRNADRLGRLVNELLARDRPVLAPACGE